MDKLELYLEIIPLPLVIGVGFFALMIYLIIPAETRFFMTFVIMPPWLVLSRSIDLGFIAAFTKLTSGLLFLLMGLAALLRPKAKRSVPGIAWFYLIGSFYLLICLLGVIEMVDTMAIEIQWIFAVLAGIAAVATLTTLEDVHKMLWALGFGLIIATCIPLSAIIIEPGSAFRIGLNRFTPWGAAANLIGLLFVVGGPTLLYMIMSARSNTIKPILIGMLIASIGMAILTGSRMTVFSLFVSLGLMAIPLVKRPGLMISGALVGAILLPIFLGVNEQAASRLGALSSSGRVDIWLNYLQLSLSRPLGLFGTGGLSVLFDPSIGAHPHSSWVEMLYLGGWPYLIMMAFPAIYGLRCAYQVWRNRSIYATGNHQFLIHALAAFIASIYFQSLFNQSLYYPTYTLSFLGILVTVLFMALKAEMPYQREVYEDWLQEWHDEEDESSENWDESPMPAPT
ncbi:MAG: hypothetical protein VX527_06230 [Planctomycetota bacterium]|nr:hypothetical protein [Planctomycetota bacterium]